MLNKLPKGKMNKYFNVQNSCQSKNKHLLNLDYSTYSYFVFQVSGHFPLQWLRRQLVVSKET